MIGHLFTLLFTEEEEPPVKQTYGGGGGADDAMAFFMHQEHLRNQRNTAAVHFIVALVASGELD